jgi:hypothetical protein
MRRQIPVALAALVAVGGVLAADTATGSITRFGIYKITSPPDRADTRAVMVAKPIR